MFLTSAPWDRLLFLRAGEGSADCRGVRPPFFNSSPEGDFGTVHTGTPSERPQGSVRVGGRLSLNKSEEECVWDLEMLFGPGLRKTHISYLHLTFNTKVGAWLTERKSCLRLNRTFVQSYIFVVLSRLDQTVRTDKQDDFFLMPKAIKCSAEIWEMNILCSLCHILISLQV